jgi:hypothetical protein
VNGYRIVAIHQHMPTPLAHAHNEQLDLEIGGRLPLKEKTSSARFWLFSYSVGDPCGRSNQLIMYFFVILH